MHRWDTFPVPRPNAEHRLRQALALRDTLAPLSSSEVSDLQRRLAINPNRLDALLRANGALEGRPTFARKGPAAASSLGTATPSPTEGEGR